MRGRRAQPCRRIVITGTTGAGKTVLAASLARKLDLVHLRVDELRHAPDGHHRPPEWIRSEISNAVGLDAWVVDTGDPLVGDLVWRRAQALVWLAYPLRVCLWRIARREIGGPGNPRVRPWRRRALPVRVAWEAMHTINLLRLSVLFHWKLKRRLPAVLSSGAHSLEIVRLRSPRETEAWLDGLPGAAD